MGPGSFIPGFDRAQEQYENQTPEDFETEDDIPNIWADIEEEEREGN